MTSAVLAIVLMAAGQLQPVEIAKPMQRLRPAMPALPRDFSATGGQAVARRDPMASPVMRGDVRLRDVCFVDATRGWAVGDRGAIWHTADGGAKWQLQRSGVTCVLESVFFLDPNNGWAAGRRSHCYTQKASGVLLSTRDGGRTWHHNPKEILPPLKQVRFFNAKHGWVAGSPSGMYPTGVLTTQNGGRDWQPISGERMAAWLAADFVDPHTGALAGRSGTVGVVRRAGLQPAVLGQFGLRNLTRMKLTPTHGWMIGDGGLVMMTTDLGARWQTPEGRLPGGMARHFDFAALAVLGPRCWIAGSPGTHVFHTADAGRTWMAFPTGTNLPIHAMTFVDDRHGWAVGALGTILATDDGGQSWKRQRAGGTRAALMAVLDQPRHVPFELFAQLSADEGYYGVAEILGRRHVEVPRPELLDAADLAAEAMAAVGASDAHTAWQFPLRQGGLALASSQIIRTWDQANDGRGLEEFQRHIVRQIRVWRPDVIVTHDASPLGNDPLKHVINQTVLAAVESASDPTRFTDQVTQAGLRPWKVKKVFAALPVGSRGTVELTTAKLAMRMGRSVAELAAGPRGLVDETFRASPPSLGFQVLMDRMETSASKSRQRRDLFAGIGLHPGGEARRSLLEASGENLEQLRRSAIRRRNIQAILEQAKNEPEAGPKMLAKAASLVGGLDNDNAARLLYQLAEQYFRAGEWPLAAETYELLAKKYPEHALARPAMLWLVRYYASSEATWREQGKQRFAVKQASALSVDLSKQQDRAQRAADLGRKIQERWPTLFAEPSLRFPLAVAHCKQGYPRTAEKFYLSQSRSGTHDAWWACAKGENWIASPTAGPGNMAPNAEGPKPMLRCARAPAKPRLDGLLTDAVWKTAKAAPLRSSLKDDERWAAAVLTAYDGEFLYLAVQCRQAPGVEYAATDAPRVRDADLAKEDRVDFYLDIDRDAATYYRLTVDHRGWTAEGCWGDATWNPTWFVAAKSGDGTWTAEAAIPLEDLTGDFPQRGSIWSIGVQRVVPNVGFQSWTQPASTSVMPEGFGYLRFD